MDKLVNAFKLAEENKIEEAYDEFSKLLDNHKFSADARYSRAMLDISKLKKHTNETIKDLEYLIVQQTKYSKISYSFLALIYDELDQIENTIKYARLAITNKTPFVNEINFALARALARTTSIKNLEEALSLIDECLNQDEDSEQMSYQMCKCDVLISLARYDLANKEIDSLVSNFGHSGLTYYLKARLALKEYNTTQNSSLLDDVINFATIALQYEEEDYSSKILLIEAYTLSKQYQEAIKIIDSMKEYNSQEDILMEKIKVYDVAKDYQTGLSLMQEFLKDNKSWKIKYMEGAFTLEQDSSVNSKEYAVECFKEAYSLFNTTGILNDIIKINRSMDKEIDSYNYLKERLSEKEDGLLYFFLAEVAYRLEKEYEEVNGYYQMAYKLGYLDENEYYDSVCNYVEDIKSLDKKIKKLEKKNLASTYVWSRRKTAIRYIFEENGYKQNLKLAKKIIQSCLNEFGTEPCTLTLMGRCLELAKKPNEAFNYYNQAYLDILEKTDIDCDCPYGYYAHAKIEGVGCEVNLDDAKIAIKKAIEINNVFTTSHIAYYYAYFYLLGDDNFDGEFAKKLLETNYPFYRYEISRIVLLSQICKKLNQKSNKLIELLNTLNLFDKKEIKYYNDNINKTISKPYWKNI